MGPCPHYDCTNRNSFGYCNTTACINSNYNFRALTTQQQDKCFEWAWYALHAVPMYDGNYEYEMDNDTYWRFVGSLEPLIRIDHTKARTLFGLPVTINNNIKGIRLVSVVTCYNPDEESDV